MVQLIKLEHPGGLYIYRIHHRKLQKLCTQQDLFHKLQTYMQEVFGSCPDTYFHTGPRSSKLKFKTEHSMVELQTHEVCTLAKHGLEHNKERFKDNHSKVQLFMLENDNNTVGIEIPVWIEEAELPGFQEFFGSTKPLTGHIDVLRVEGEHIWVWDYKPKAQKEKFANTQVYFYTLMLSARTGIPLEHFRCGYFDDKDAYIFEPKNINTLGIVNKNLNDY